MEGISYNYFLYRKRNEKKMSRKRFAKFLHLSHFSYALIEKGYAKPTKKETEKISSALKLDFKPYLEGTSSYPEELPEKKRRKISNKAYHILSFRWVKIVCSCLAAFFFAVMIAGFCLENYVNNNARSFYSEQYLTYFDSLRSNGSTTFSITSDFTRPEIYYEDENFFISIKGSFNENKPSNIDYSATYHFDDYRLNFRYEAGKSNLRGNLYYYDSEDNYQVVFGDMIEDPSSLYKTSYPIVSLYKNATQLQKGSEDYEKAELLFETGINYDYLSLLDHQFDQLIYLELDLDMDLVNDVFPELEEGGKKQTLLGVVGLSSKIGGLVLTALACFGLCFSIFYGEKTPLLSIARNERFQKAKEESKKPKYEKLKTDWKFAPFLPETFLEFVGIIMVFAGSLRVLYYFMVFLGSAYVSGNEFTEIPMTFFRLLLIGMFLLYYIDFDCFMNDKRIIRCIITYLILFFALFGIELIGFNWVGQASYLVVNFAIVKVEKSIPNNFGSIACYFLLMFFLFHRPNFVKSNRGRVIFRLCSLLPILIILSTTLISIFYSDWGWDLPRAVILLLKAEKPQFSILCVSYLVLFYFLRLYYHKKLGSENAIRYFNGNKFIWQKNIMVSLIVLAISICEFSLSGNKAANSHGFGNYGGLIFLIPLLLFYHPHKGERNLGLDWTTLGLYGFSFAIGYVIIALAVFDAILNEGFSIENIMQYFGNHFVH